MALCKTFPCLNYNLTSKKCICNYETYYRYYWESLLNKYAKQKQNRSNCKLQFFIMILMLYVIVTATTVTFMAVVVVMALMVVMVAARAVVIMAILVVMLMMVVA